MIEINNIYNMDCLEGMDLMIKQGKYLANNAKDKTSHPTQKPTSLIEYLINVYTNEGDTVVVQQLLPA